MWRLYTIPLETGVPHPLPLYVAALGLTGRFASMAYGQLPSALVAADTTDAEHASLIANADVTAIPADLDQQVAAGLNTVRAKLEALGIPADWVVAGDTFRTVVRSIAGLFQFGQAYNGMFAAPLPIVGAGALDLRWSQLTATDRQRFLDCAISLGYDLAFVGNNTPLRQILKALADQWGDRPFFLGGMTF
jgi:hypothetical protein